jgi:hypothetical protein
MKFVFSTFKNTLLRNVVLLFGMGLLLYASPNVLAGLSMEVECRDFTIGPDEATCLRVALCTPGDRRRLVFLWLTNDTYCPDYTPTVLNRVGIDGHEGDVGLLGSAQSSTIPAFQPVAAGIAYSRCDGIDFVNFQVHLENCNIVINPNPPNVPDICYGPGCYPGQHVSPCSFCSYNWQNNAACQGPYTSGNCGGGPFVVINN